MHSRVAQTKAFSDAQNALIRDFLARLIEREFDGNQSRAARAIGMRQASLNEFMSRKRGAGMKMLEGVSKAAGVPISKVLGEETERTKVERLDQFPARARAVAAWREAMDRAIDSVVSMQFNGAETFGDADWTNYLDTAMRSFRRGDANDPRASLGSRIATRDDD